MLLQFYHQPLSMGEVRKSESPEVGKKLRLRGYLSLSFNEKENASYTISKNFPVSDVLPFYFRTLLTFPTSGLKKVSLPNNVEA
jgi:hypothetical protein